MTVINMLRGGKANGPNGDLYTQNMYPRPDLKTQDMAQNDGWENRNDSFHISAKFDLSLCWSSGAVQRAKAADTGTTEDCLLEVGDRIPMVWVPNNTTIEAVTMDIVSGIGADGAGLFVQLGVDWTDVTFDDWVIGGGTPDATLPITGVKTTPIPNPAGTVDQAYLDAFTCNDRIPLGEFCPACENKGIYTEAWEATPVLVGAGTSWAAGRYYSLVIEALPTDFECSDCCLNVDVGVRIRVPRAGN